MNNKFYRFMISGFFILLALGACAMPELAPELYVGTLDIKADVVNINNPGVVNITYGKEYIYISKSPGLIYYKGDSDPGSNNWAKTDLEITLSDKEGKETPVKLADCTFTPVDMTTVGVQPIKVSLGDKTAEFSIVVLDRGSAFQGIAITQLPTKRVYRPYEPADWTGLKITEVIYGGYNMAEPKITVYDYDSDEITIDPVAHGVLFDVPAGRIPVIVAKGKYKAPFVVTLLDLTWYVDPAGTGDGSSSGTAALPTVQPAVDEIAKGYTKYAKHWPKVGGDLEEAVIIVSGEITKPENGNMVDITTGAPIRLTGGGILNRSKKTGYVLIIGKGSKVTLENLTLKGGYSHALNGGGGVYVKDSGTFTMKGGTICGNEAFLGGGVFVDEGTFTMEGGTISDNKVPTGLGLGNIGGGGVCVRNKLGTFTMTGGTITENKAPCGGGVKVWVEDGVSSYLKAFTKTGGSITKNEASNTKNGHSVYDERTGASYELKINEDLTGSYPASQDA